MRLADLRPGERAVVSKIMNDTVRAQAIRFGIAEGSEISCEEVISRGPVMIRRGLMQYAIGRKLAEQIAVHPRFGGRRHRGGR
ncbi:MAG: FeoA family protein [Bacillota bacterium]|jgi:Fe2+ transport system protein FeoA